MLAIFMSCQNSCQVWVVVDFEKLDLDIRLAQNKSLVEILEVEIITITTGSAKRKVLANLRAGLKGELRI